MSSNRAMQTVAGLATARGFALGPAFVYRGEGEFSIPEYAVESGAEEAELIKFSRALVAAKRDIENLIAALKQHGGKDDVKVFECHLMLAEDPTLQEMIEGFVHREHLNAPAAVRKAMDSFRSTFSRMNDAYFRERVRDLDDVERRIQKALAGLSGELRLELKSPAIVVADDLTPSEAVQLPREYVLGFATNRGSTTSHVALLARSLGIPAVAGLGDITERVEPGETLLLDGAKGTVTLKADTSTLLEFRDLVERQREINEDAQFGAPAGTLKDGGGVLLYANTQPGAALEEIRRHGACGIGLYRSEYLWLNRELEPTEEEQYAAYREAAAFTASISPEATLTLRLLDIGGDKLVRGITAKEANPFLGNRSIRFLLTHEEVFRTQLRAALRASTAGKICLLYPMISCVEELKACARLLEEVKRELDRQRIAYDPEIKVGAMIEVPAAAISAAAFAKYVDFFSIGTNDLVQYLMAADRGNDSVVHLYQPTHPAVIELMRGVIAAAKAARIHIGVCGESAADPVVGVLWAAMGVDMLSMTATYIPMISKLLSRLTRADLVDYIQSVEALPDDSTGEEVFKACHQFLKSRIPDFDNIVI